MVKLVESSPEKMIEKKEKKIKKVKKSKVKQDENNNDETLEIKKAIKSLKRKKTTEEKVAPASDEEVAKPKKVKKSKKVKADKKEKIAAEETNGNGVTNGGEKTELSPVEQEGSFDNFRISQLTRRKLQKKGIQYLFPIQAKTFNHVYDGKDVVAQARTGTGKTMSFAIPLVEKLMAEGNTSRYGREPSVLVMAPTRELAVQVHRDFDAIATNLSTVCVYGGTPYFPQEKAMRQGVDIVVGTPGRINDHVEKGNLKLRSVKHVVLDEVDQMLDMGFAPIVEEILSSIYTDDRGDHPPQTLLFSATCPAWVKRTAAKYLKKENLVNIDIIGTAINRTSTTVEHLAVRCFWQSRPSCIANCVRVYSGQHGRAMVFTETKKECNELSVTDGLQQLKAQVLHGDIDQKHREITLKAFREGKVRCLVATNVAARGLDIPEVDLVVQTAPPKDIESYIHRSGRTGRAGRNGVCLCVYSPKEEQQLRHVEQTAGIKFRYIGPPQPKDIVEASIKDTLASLKNIDTSLISQFSSHAESMASQYEGGAMEALAAAITYISGATKLKSSSLLNAQDGYTTWILRCNFEMNYVSKVFTTVQYVCGEEIRNKMVGARLTKDQRAACFDLPDDLTEDVLAYWEDDADFKLEKCTELPDLAETSFRSNGGGRFGGGRGRSFGGGRGGRGRGGGRSFGGRSNGFNKGKRW